MFASLTFLKGGTAPIHCGGRIEWIRFLYSYPETITDDLIEVLKNNNKVCKYLDIPMQHISNSVLKRMNRKSTKESTYKLIEKLR